MGVLALIWLLQGCSNEHLFDFDGDGFGSVDADCDTCTDCDDNNIGVSPRAAEVCDGIDNNCDGVVDEGLLVLRYADLDGDGWGDADQVEVCVSQTDGFSEQTGDCDDVDASVSPQAVEHCNGRDDNCDSVVDEDAEDASLWYLDDDGDGYGVDGSEVPACEAPPAHVSDAGDCDDADADANPGETAGCGLEDLDCDGLLDGDGDGDGEFNTACGGVDCDDADPLAFPGPGGACPLHANCDALGEAFPGAVSGDYWVDLGSGPSVATCDLETDGGRWTMVLHTEAGSAANCSGDPWAEAKSVSASLGGDGELLSTVWLDGATAPVSIVRVGTGPYADLRAMFDFDFDELGWRYPGISFDLVVLAGDSYMDATYWDGETQANKRELCIGGDNIRAQACVWTGPDHGYCDKLLHGGETYDGSGGQAVHRLYLRAL